MKLEGDTENSKEVHDVITRGINWGMLVILHTSYILIFIYSRYSSISAYLITL
jgi:hypothetical protein